MSALHKLAMAFVTVVGGVEVVVLDAVPSPVRSDLQTAATLTVGALAVGLGMAFALGTAFGAGTPGPGRRRADDGEAAPNGIPPWWDEDDAADAQPAATLVDMDAVAAVYEPSPFALRERGRADAWTRHDADDTQQMTAVEEDADADLLVPWRPQVAPDAPWSPAGLAFMRVEVCEAYDKRHAAERAADVTDWFGMAAERQNGQVAA